MRNVCVFFFALMLLSACSEYPATVPQDLSGGLGVAVHSSTAFKNKVPGIDSEGFGHFAAGRSFFQQPWVIAPTATIARDGLGPLLNANACSACHNNNGQGKAPEEGGLHSLSTLVRLSMKSADTDNLTSGVIPHPHYGTQFQDKANFGLKPEGKLSVQYVYSEVKTADGEAIQLRKPQWSFHSLSNGPVLIEGAEFSVRVAPRIVGMGLLDSIPEQQLEALADPNDQDADGISGKIARSFDVESQSWSVGRYGWKAEVPTLKQQVAAALNGDMGLTSSLFPAENCTKSQSICAEQASGSNDGVLPEVEDKLLGRMTFYTAHLAVPTARLSDQAQRGWGSFVDIGCVKCHAVGFKTAGDGLLANKEVWPFSDLLLHDMGPDLADGRSIYNASASEWRTPPLWGIGLAQKVVRKRAVNYLHDGRARTVQEAIVWHGGEAQRSRDAFLDLSAQQRADLLKFIESI